MERRTRPLPAPVSPAQVQEYQEQGFVRLGRWLSPAQVDAARAALDHLPAPAFQNPYGRLVHDARLLAPGLWEAVDGPGLGAVACALTARDRVVLFQDNLVWKTPGAARIEWHQDYSYQPLSAPAGVTLWLALDDADTDSGCLHQLPGTHRLGERAPADFIRGTGQAPLPGLPPLEPEAHADRILALPALAGELLAHHPLTWHMSPENRSPRQRRALSLNFLEPEVVWRPDHAPHPFNHTLRPVAGQALDPARFPVYGAVSTP